MASLRTAHRLLARAAAHLRTAMVQWRDDSRGNAVVYFAFAIVPILGMMGLGTDYYRGLSYKSRLDAATDSAALAAIQTAQSYIGANAQSQYDPTANAIAAGRAQAVKVFNVNAASSLLYVPATPTVTMTRSGQVINAVVTYATAMPTAFGSIFGLRTFGIKGTSTASLTMGQYLDFYLVLDTSGSMGLPTTDAGQTALAAISPDQRNLYPTGCMFACHFPGYQGYALSRTNNIALRADSVGAAVQSVLQTARQTQTLPSQYRVGLYPFIVHAAAAADLSADFTQANTAAANLAQYLDPGVGTSPWGSGGTHFDNLQNDMMPYIRTIGTGANAQSPKPFIFLVTDGANNSQTYNGSFSGGSNPALPDLSFCGNAKNAGITISVLYTPYVPIQNPNPNFAGNEDGKVNAIIPSIAPALRDCASPGFFFTANSPQDITNAMQAMFNQAVMAARLIN